MGRLNLHIVFLLLSPLFAMSQQRELAIEKQVNADAVETAYLHVNTTSLVTGETLLYKFYCIDKTGKASPVSKVAYVELYGSQSDKPVFSQKLFLESGSGSGDYLVLPELATGNYKLIGFTNHMQRRDRSYISVDLLFINPFIASPDQNEISVSNEITASAATTLPNTLIITSRSEYEKREQIEIKATQKLLGNYSLSVRRIDAISSRSVPNASTSAVSIGEKNHSIFTEARGEIITGKITSKNGASVAKRNVSLSIAGENPVFKIVETNADGAFLFTIDHTYTSGDAVVQVMGEDRENFVTSVDSDHVPMTIAVDKTYRVSPSLADAISARSLAAQIENAYYAKKKDSISIPSRIPLFYESIAKTYVLSDYTDFKEFRETITEVVKDAYFSFDKGVYSLRVRDYDLMHEVDQPSLVLVDGIQLQNLKSLFEYPPSDIDRIETVSGGYYYQSARLNGILSVTTKRNDFISTENGDYLKRVAIGVPNQNKKYFQPDYASQPNKRIPDYRQQLLWLPNVASLSEPISFYASDVAGTYEIVFQGFNNDGTPVSSRSLFTVR